MPDTTSEPEPITGSTGSVASAWEALCQIELICEADTNQQDSAASLGADIADLVAGIAAMSPDSAAGGDWGRVMFPLARIADLIATRIHDLQGSEVERRNQIYGLATRGRAAAARERANAIAAAHAAGDPRAATWETDERARMRDAEADSYAAVQADRAA